MKTFTSRDLSRSAAEVLAASEEDGVATIRTRDGRMYELRPAAARSEKAPTPAAEIENHLTQILALKAKRGGSKISKAQWREIDRLITERPL